MAPRRLVEEVAVEVRLKMALAEEAEDHLRRAGAAVEEGEAHPYLG